MTIAQQIKWDFKTNGHLKILDKNGNIIYWENSNSLWLKWKYDFQGQELYHQSSNGFWTKREYDSKGNRVYYEDSYGLIIDNRPKTCEGKIVEIDGEKFKLVKA